MNKTKARNIAIAGLVLFFDGRIPFDAFRAWSGPDYPADHSKEVDSAYPNVKRALAKLPEGQNRFFLSEGIMNSALWNQRFFSVGFPRRWDPEAPFGFVDSPANSGEFDVRSHP